MSGLRPHRRRRRGAVREPRRDRRRRWASQTTIARDRKTGAGAGRRARLRRRADRRAAARRRRHVAAGAAARPLAVPASGDGHRQRDRRGRDRRRAGRRVRLRAQAGLSARPARHGPRARSIRRRSTASASACASELERSERRHRELVESVARVRAGARRDGAHHHLEPRARARHRLSRGPRCWAPTAARFVGAGRDARATCRSRRAASARSAGAAPRSTGRGRRADGLRRRHRRHRRGRDAAPAAPLRAAGGRRDHGRRPGARGAQPAQLGVAAAHACWSAGSTQRRCRPTGPAHRRASSRARSIASTAWCGSSSPSRSRRRSSRGPSTWRRCSPRVAGLIAPRGGGGPASRSRSSADGTAACPRATRERLRQVLLNLTRNAIEAMDERGGRLTPARRGPQGARSRSTSRTTVRGSPRSCRSSTPSSRPRTRGPASALAGSPDRRRPRRHDPRRLPPRPDLLHLHAPGREAGPLTLAPDESPEIPQVSRTFA